MTAFDPPANTRWCPTCARERVSCTHLEAGSSPTTDGGEPLRPDGETLLARTEFYVLKARRRLVEGKPVLAEKYLEQLERQLADAEGFE